MSGSDRTVICTDWFPPSVAGGGPARSLEAVVEILRDAQLTVITRDRDLGSSDPYAAEVRWSRSRADIRYVRATGAAGPLRVARELVRSRPEVLYVNSLFSTAFGLLPILLVAMRILRPRKVVLAPRGELAAGALRLKRWKKMVFLIVMMPVYRRIVDVFHATAPTEHDDIRRRVGSASIKVVSNVAKPLPPVPVGERLRNRRRPVFEALYLGRISPKKNLHNVIRAAAACDVRLSLGVAGPVHDQGYYRACAQLAGAVPEHVQVNWLGTQDRDQVPALLRTACLLVHPSLDENFGHAIVEALMTGCPVVVGPSTPWSAEIDGRAGVVVDPDDYLAIAKAIDWVATISDDEYVAMSSCAALVGTRIAGLDLSSDYRALLRVDQD